MSNAAELDTLPAVDIPTKTTEVPIIEGELMNNTASMEASGVMGDDIDQQFTTLETIRDVDDSRNAEQETITTDTDTKPTESIESIDEYASAHSIDEYASANSVLDRGDFSQHTDTADSGDAIARDRIVHADNLAGAATIAEETEVSETSAVHSVTDEQVHQDVTDNDESAGGGVTIIQDNASEVGATGSADCSQRTDGTDKTSEIDTADDVKDVKEDTNVTNAVSGDVVSVPHGSNKGDTPGDADEKDTESIVVDVKDSMPDAEAGVGDSESVETQGSTVNDISEVAEEKDGQRVAHKTETESVKVNCKRKEEGEGNSTSKGDEVKTGVVAKVTNDRPSAMGLKGKDDKKSKKKDKKKAAKEEKEKIDKSQKKSPGSFRRFVRKLSQEKLKLATPSGSSGNSPTTTKINASTAGVTSTPTWAEQQLKGTQGMADMFANRMRQSPSINNPSGVIHSSRGGPQLNRQQSRTHAEISAKKELNKTDAANERLIQTHTRQRSGMLRLRKQSNGNMALKLKQDAEADEATSGISSQLHKEARELKQQKSKKDVTKEAALDLQDNDQENRELDIQFQRVLREMKVKPAERDAKYANMGQVQKYKMIVDYRAKKGWGDESARAYVAALDKHNDRHMLELDLSDVMLDLGAITVHLRNKPASWIMDFRKCKGLEALTAVIIKLYHIMSQNIGELDSVVIAETMHQAVRSVSMYMRIPESFDDAARNTNLLKTITKLLAEDAISDRLCADVLEFLAVVSLSGETGHAHALDALQFLKLVDKEQFRFQYVIKLLLKDSPELRVACMQMINSVTNAPHLTVDHRVHLRNEIMAAGLRGALPTLREHAAIDEQLRTHVVLWEDNSKWDREQLHSRVKMVQLGYSNAAESYSLLLDVTKGAVAQIHLNRMIQSLILFINNRDISVSGRDVQVPRSAYFRLCERISQQVVLPDDGFDPQFNTFFIDSSTVQEEHVEISELSTLTDRLRLLETVFSEAVNCKAIDILRMCDNIGKYEKRQKELRLELGRLSKLTKFNTTNEILRTEHREKVRLIFECKRAEIAREEAYQKVLAEADDFIQRYGNTPIRLGEANEGGALQTRTVLSGALFAEDGQDIKNEGFKAGTGAIFGLVDESLYAPKGTAGTPLTSGAATAATAQKGMSLADQLKAKQLTEPVAADGVKPPPPPPPMGGPGGPPPPPPPPPPGMKAVVRKKKPYKVKPEAKMRRINWIKITDNKLKGTFWDSVDEERHIDAMDFEELNDTFSVAKQTSALKAKMEVQLERDISLVSHKTAQNVSILLSKILSAHSIQWLCDRLMRCDYKAHPECTIEIWQGLARTKLEKTEIEAVTTFRADTQKLAMPDRFLNFALNHVPGYYGRLDAIVYEHNFNGIYDTAYERISTLLLAAREVRTSTVLRDTMAAILVIGNYMNCSVKGATEVTGFQLSFLTKLTGTKTQDNKGTLLDFLSEMLTKKGITPTSLEDEIPNVCAASALSNQAVVEDIKLLRQGMNSLKKTVKELPSLDMNDMFRDTFGRFINKSESRVEELNGEFNTMTAACTEAMTFFGADPNRVSSDEMFLQLATFLQDLKDIVKKKEDAKTKAEAAKRRREAAQEKRFAKAREVDLVKATQVDAVNRRDSTHMQMPNILADVRSGRAFTRNHDMPEIEDAANELTKRMTQYYGPTTASMEDLSEAVA